jgi:hypothetical protein
MLKDFVLVLKEVEGFFFCSKKLKGLVFVRREVEGLFFFVFGG